MVFATDACIHASGCYSFTPTPFTWFDVVTLVGVGYAVYLVVAIIREIPPSRRMASQPEQTAPSYLDSKERLDLLKTAAGWGDLSPTNSRALKRPPHR